MREHPKKTIRLSLLWQIALLFILTLIISIVVTNLAGRNREQEYVRENAGRRVRRAAYTAVSIFKLVDPDFTVFTDADMRENVHGVFRSICREMDLTYLYLYTVDEKLMKHHIVNASSDPALDEKINAVAGFGTVSDTPLSDSEQKVLSGELNVGFDIFDNEYGFVCSWVIAVYNDRHEVIALLSADYSMDDIRQAALKETRRLNISILSVFAVMFSLMLILSNHSVLRPIRKLSDRMRQYAAGRGKEEPLPQKTGFISDEVTDIGDSFQVMTNEISGYLANIEELTAEKVQTQVEMDIAKGIQDGMVPPRTEKEESGISYCAFIKPAREVGGDFYDIIELENGKTGFVIGDVSGKGVSAALFMAMTCMAIRDRLKIDPNPASVLNETNHMLCGRNPEGMFATVFIAVWDLASGRLLCANAGHTTPVLFGKETKEFPVEPGITLGLFEPSNISNTILKPGPGEGLFLYTDGVTEAANTEKQQFGRERLLALLKENGGSTAAAVDAVTSEVLKFEKEAGQFDDITVLALMPAEKSVD